MLACVCQPVETTLYKGGPPTEVGPLGTNVRKHQRPKTLKTHKPPKPLPKPNQSQEDTEDSTATTPKLSQKSPKTLSLRKIEEKAKCTKILVNPVCCDSGSPSDESYTPSSSNSSSTNITKSKKHKYNGNKVKIKNSKINTDIVLTKSELENEQNAIYDKPATGCFKKRNNSTNTTNVNFAQRADTHSPKTHKETTEESPNTKSRASDSDSIYGFERRSDVNSSISDAKTKFKINGGSSIFEERRSVVNSSISETISKGAAVRKSVDQLRVKKTGNYEEDEDNKEVRIIQITNRINRSPDASSTDTLLGEGVELTVGELRAMALRQQRQIDAQHQLLAAKEQRLRYLKQQEARQHQVAAEGERLRRLRERVEAQELKLRKLRALRGHVDRNRLNNLTLTSDLESIRALFNEKEKELSVAVAKVEELTRQLEELRRGRAPPAPPAHNSAAAHDLEKLRRELMYRNKLNEQQNARLSAQRSALGARQDEMRAIDRRIAELQARLLRKRALNRQMARHAAAVGPADNRLGNPAPVQLSNYQNSGANGAVVNKSQLQQSRGNVAAVEPYNHVPHPAHPAHPAHPPHPAHLNINYQALKQNSAQNNVPLKQSPGENLMQNHMTQQEAHFLQQKQMMNNPMFNNGAYPHHTQNTVSNEQYIQQYSPKHGDMNVFANHVQQGITNPYYQQNDPKLFPDKYSVDVQKQMNYSPNLNGNNLQHQNPNQISVKDQKINEQEFLPEFAASKSDPKYQTLPYNTKFPINGSKGKPGSENFNKGLNEHEMAKSGVNSASVSNVNHMTVHSTPLSVVNKSLATPLSQTESSNAYQNEQFAYQIQKSESSGRCNQEGKENVTYQNHGKMNGVGGMGSKSQASALGRMENLIKGATASASSASSSSSLASSSLGYGKPVSSVAPTSVQVASGKPSPIYQTSSTKIQPVQPQTVSHNLPANNVASGPTTNGQTANGLATPNGPCVGPRMSASVGGSTFSQNASSQSLLLSPPQSASTPFSTPDTSADKSTPKPALPPKPAVKTPPRQSAVNEINFVQPGPHEQGLPDITTPEQDNEQNLQKDSPPVPSENLHIIKARPLTIRKGPLSEQPKLRSSSSGIKNGISVSNNRRIEMPPAFLFPEMDHLTLDTSAENGLSKEKSNGNKHYSPNGSDELDRAPFHAIDIERSSSEENSKNSVSDIVEQIHSVDLNNPNSQSDVARRSKKGNLKQSGKVNLARRVSFDPLALLLDASLEGELELVKKTATQVVNASAANDEGITALHNAICAGHIEIVKFLVEFGCDVNAQDSDGWTPLHCAASCNNLNMVRFLVEHGACIFATTLSDHETAAEKCEEDEEGFDGCSEYLYSVQEKLGIMNGGAVFAVYEYAAVRGDELSFSLSDRLSVVRKGDECEREWWWSRDARAREGYVPRNLLGLYPRVSTQHE